MHKPNSRLVSLFAGTLLVFAGVTCTDSPTGPQSGSGLRALVGFAPSFSKAAADIYHNLVSFGVEVDNIHLRLERANGQLVLDTIVIRNAGQNEIVIELTVPLNAPQEQLNAVVELRDGTIVLFSGTQNITAVAGAFPSTPPPFPLEFTGPGSTATTLLVEPVDTTIFTTDSVLFRASATDQNKENVPELLLTWSVQNVALGSVDGQGKFKPTPGRGATNVKAELPNGLQASAHVNIVPPASQVVVVAGGGQTGIVGQVLSQAITIEARAADNLPVPNARLNFSVTGGGGSVSPPTALADASGHVSIALTLGTVAGANTIDVTGPGITPLTISVTGTADVASKLVVVQQPSATVASGAVLPTQPKAQLQDQFGNVVALANVAVTAVLSAPNSSGHSLGGTVTVNTNSSGVAEFTDLAISGPAGTSTLTFNAATVVGAISTDITVGHGAAHHLAFVDQPANGTGGSPLAPITVQVLDQFGNRVTTGPGATSIVTLALTGGAAGAVLGPTPASLTAAAVAGLATFNVSVDKAATGYALQATSAAPIVAGASTVFSIAVGPPAQLMAVSGDGQGALSGGRLINSLVVLVVDAGSNPVPAANVTFTASSGGSVTGGGTTGTSIIRPTDTNGLASVNWTVGSGPQELTATSGVGSVLLHAYIAEKLIVETPAPVSVPSGAMLSPPPSVRLADNAGHLVKLGGITIGVELERVDPIGDYVIELLGTNSAVTDGNGIAVFPTLGIQGDLEQHVRLKFVRLEGETQDPSIAPIASETIILQPGFPSVVRAQDFIERHRLSSPATKRLGFVISDPYNNVPDVPVAFDVLQGASNCTLANATPKSDASGLVTVDVTASRDLSSCVVRARVDLPPPTSGGDGPPAEMAPPAQFAQRLYVAADAVRIWTGDFDNQFSGSSGNWFNQPPPDFSTPVFIPGASFYNNPHIPTVGSPGSILSLLIESGASLNLNGQALTLSDNLMARGPLNGGGIVTLNSPATEPRFVSGAVHALLKIGAPETPSCSDTPGVGAYIVESDLNVDNIEINCTLVLANDYKMVVDGDLAISGGSGQLAQTDGHLTVGRNVTLNSGALVVNDGFLGIADALNVTPGANLSQGGGQITVGGDARFDGSQALTGGTLELKKNFVHNGNCDNLVFYAANPHITRFTGTATDVLTITSNTPCATQFGTLELATSGGNGVKLIADPIFEGPAVHAHKVIINPGSILDMEPRFYINMLGDESGDALLLIQDKATLKLQGTISPFPTCTPDQPDGLITGATYNGPLSCTFRPPS